jgi:YVTN family beta-propeller protein
MEFRVLGPLEVVDDGRTLKLGSGKQLALVAALLLHANEAVPVDRLVDELWGESPPPTAAKIVRNYVSLLRRELGDRLVTQPTGYLLRVDDGELDRERLERAIDSGDLGPLEQALSLWRGPPLSQVAYEPFAQAEIARLEELRLTALEARFEALLALGRHVGAVAELEALAKQHPLRERLTELLMLALYRSGRQADALDAYRRTRRALDEQLGIEPGPDLRELERRILNQDPSLAAPRPPIAERFSTRRRALALAVVGLLVVGAVVAAFVVTGDSAGGLREIPANYVGVIDPVTNSIDVAIPVGIRPGPVAARRGVVWVGNLQDRSVTRIDARSRARAGTSALGDRTPTDVAAGAGAVWVVHGGVGEISQLDPQFGRVLRTVGVTERPHAVSSGGVAVGEGFVWAVFADSTLARLRPSDARLAGSTLVGDSPAAVVVGGGAVWVANAGGSTVQRFDPVTFQQGPIRTITVGRRPVALAFGYGSVWVATAGDDTVTRIDPATSATLDIRVGDSPVALAVGAGRVWVANEADGTLSSIDPGANEVERTIDVGNAPAGIAVADGVVWVAVQAP